MTRINTYLLSHTFYGSGVQACLRRALFSVTHKTAIKISAKTCSLILAKDPFWKSLGRWQDLVPSGCRTESLSFLLALCESTLSSSWIPVIPAMWDPPTWLLHKAGKAERGPSEMRATILYKNYSKKIFTTKITSISALLTMPKTLTVWITINCGKFWNRWEYQTTWSASWETYMQVRKQQFELDMEQQTASEYGKEYVEGVYCHPAYLT